MSRKRFLFQKYSEHERVLFDRIWWSIELVKLSGRVLSDHFCHNVMNKQVFDPFPT